MDDLHVQPVHDRPFGRLPELVPNQWMPQERALEIDRQTCLLIERDAAQVLGVNRRRDVGGDNGATTAGAGQVDVVAVVDHKPVERHTNE